MAGLGMGALGGAGGVLAAEVFAPLLLLCWLCCWPDDDRSDSSSGKYQPQKPVVPNESNCRHRSNETLGRRRFGSSAVSLHLPSTSGQAEQTLAAHRSHEEIRAGPGCRRPTRDARYHSAPSVIHEVVHRRDWDRSARELHIPLKSDNDSSHASDGTDSDHDYDRNEPETVRTCKKHYANIKSSHKKENKETLNDDDKDDDATEDATNFYIGEPSLSPDENDNDKQENSRVFKAKEAKQCLNESIRCKDRQRQPLIPLTEFQVAGFDRNIDDTERDRSGAIHHSVESRSSLFNPRTVPVPPPSVEVVGYDWEAAYLEETGAAGVWRAGAGGAGAGGAGAGGAGAGGAGAGGSCWPRPRHASAGDVLAPTLRPQSGALSESELDWELEELEVRGKETAI